MRSSFIAPLVMLAALVLYAQQPMPRMTSVEPDSAKADPKAGLDAALKAFGG